MSKVELKVQILAVSKQDPLSRQGILGNRNKTLLKPVVLGNWHGRK